MDSPDALDAAAKLGGLESSDPRRRQGREDEIRLLSKGGSAPVRFVAACELRSLSPRACDSERDDLCDFGELLILLWLLPSKIRTKLPFKSRISK